MSIAVMTTDLQGAAPSGCGCGGKWLNSWTINKRASAASGFWNRGLGSVRGQKEKIICGGRREADLQMFY